MGNLKILICSDLDRTLIPNGHQAESAHCRPVFRRVVAHPNIWLAYVSGRDRKLILDAIEEYYLPVPDFVIGDVGTTLYRVIDGNWQLADEWSDEIGKDWNGLTWEGLAEYYEDIEEIQLQEPEKQKIYKLSFYTDYPVGHRELINRVRAVLAAKGVPANIVWSVDEIATRGLLDIIPARASKLHAIRFLLQREQFAEERTVFAGDSGNDLDALTGGLRAILVKNATDEVRKEAVETLSAKHLLDRLYLSEGNFWGMNGNYTAGVLEGLVHFFPETGELVASAVNKLTERGIRDSGNR